jgi:two-component sensor histidine kinase
MRSESVSREATENCEERLVSHETRSFHVAQVEHLYSQGISGVRGSLVAAVILIISLWNDVSHVRLITWIACYTGACGVGEALFHAFNKSSIDDRSIIPWKRRFVALSIVGGVLWGATPLLLFPANSISHQALLTFVLGGMSVGITISHGAVRAAYLPFILAVYAPLIGRYVYGGDETHITMGTLLFVFMVYLIGAAGRMQAAVTESLRLRFQNQGLIDVLNREKIETEKLNENLRSEVRERREAEERLRALLDEKEILLREIHHRVNNNLQVVSSLFRLQSRHIGKKSPEDILSDSQNRILSMALIHEKLYKSKDLANIECKVYIESLLSQLFQSHGVAENRITLTKDVEQVFLPLDLAMPCGLIINEIVSNCLKHAFPNGNKGSIEFSLARTDQWIELVIKDSGAGLPENVVFGNSETLGLRLIEALVKQLQGEISVRRADGTTFHVRFPVGSAEH